MQHAQKAQKRALFAVVNLFFLMLSQYKLVEIFPIPHCKDFLLTVGISGAVNCILTNS